MIKKNQLTFLALISVVLFLYGCSPTVKSVDFVKVKAFNYPVLKGKQNNPVLRIEVNNPESEKLVQTVAFDLEKIKSGNVKSVRLFYTGQDSIFNTEVQFGETEVPASNTTISGVQKLEQGKHYFWLSMELAETADLKASVTSSLKYLQIDEERFSSVTKQNPIDLRFGVAVRQHWDDNVHTYRIPGLTTTNDGSLLAIYDVRRESGRDLQGHMDIGVSRSIDGGTSWEPMRIALDMKEWGGLPEKFNGVSDANILVDRNTGDIYIAGLWMHGVINPEGIWEEGLTEVSRLWNHQWRNRGSQPGFGVKETSQFLITKSTDDGKTWGEPVNLTQMCKKKEWWLWAPAPGHGITLTDGTLVFPTQGRDENGMPFSNITYSKDGGKTWKTSNAAYDNTTESMAVELSDGSVMLNMRNNRNRKEKGEKNGRAIATTTDLGETWTEHPTSCNALIECVCMASIHKHNYKDNDGNPKSALFFSNPNSKYTRHKQTIKVSFDDGNTWPEKYWIELDEGKSAGYSCLTSVDENTIGIIYEGSQAHMTFQQIDVQHILRRE